MANFEYKKDRMCEGGLNLARDSIVIVDDDDDGEVHMARSENLYLVSYVSDS